MVLHLYVIYTVYITHTHIWLVETPYAVRLSLPFASLSGVVALGAVAVYS